MTENDEGAVRALEEFALAFEFYADAYSGPDAPFRDQMPSVHSLCASIQEGARLAGKVVGQLNALRSQLAAAESKSLAVHEVLGKDLEVLRGRLAAAEASRDGVRASLGDGPGAQAEEIRRLRGSLAMVRKLASEDAMKLKAQRDQALARLGEAEKMLTRIRDGHEEQIHGSILEDLDSFLSRDSAGGMKS
jgi:hypothetical protein